MASARAAAGASQSTPHSSASVEARRIREVITAVSYPRARAIDPDSRIFHAATSVIARVLAGDAVEVARGGAQRRGAALDVASFVLGHARLELTDRAVAPDAG